MVNGTIYPKVVIIDENGVDKNSVRFNISMYSYSMLCTEYVQGKKYTCTGNFDTTKLTDDYYDLIFYGKDIAGNWNAEKKYLLVDNDELSGPDPADFVTTTTTTVYPTATTTTLQNSGDNTDDTNGNTGNQNTGNTQTATQVIERITTPVLVLFGNIQKGFGEIDSWTLKAFGISMVVFLFIIAVVKIVGSRKSLEPQDHELETYR